MVRQYQRSIKGLTEQQIKAKFHACDTNGNGKLDKKEFQKLLKKFGVDMGEFEQNLMMEKFDSDGDGYLDIDEFREYLNNPDSDDVTHAVKSKILPPAFSKINNNSSNNSSNSNSNSNSNARTSSIEVKSLSSSSSNNETIKKDDIEKVDVLWMARMLEEQEKLERKVGKDLFSRN